MEVSHNLGHDRLQGDQARLDSLVAIIGKVKSVVVDGEGAATVLMDTRTHVKGRGCDILHISADVLTNNYIAPIFFRTHFHPINVIAVQRNLTQLDRL